MTHDIFKISSQGKQLGLLKNSHEFQKTNLVEKKLILPEYPLGLNFKP